MSDWKWLAIEVVRAVHDRQLAEHGGLEGVRDPGALESALARPANRAAYGDPDACELAAAYAHGLAKSHAFADGNKRTAWIAARLFLTLNGVEIRFEKADAVTTVLALAAGEVSEEELAAWFRERVQISSTSLP